MNNSMISPSINASTIQKKKDNPIPWVEKYRTEEFNPRQAVTEFANEIAEIGFTVHFITDGAHNINKDNESFTQLWSELAPENLKTLTLRTNLPTITYARAISIDAFHMLKPIDLAFSEDEIELLATNYGIDYEENKVVISKVQNWPAGVLMTLKTLGKSGKAVSADFLDSQMMVEATLKNLDPEVYKILETLTYFENISKEQAELMLKSPGNLQSFQRLSAEGIFVKQIGNDGNIFQINELIRNAVKEKLKKDFDRAKIIKLNTIEVKVKTGHLAAAIGLLEDIGDVKRAKELTGLHVRILLWSSNRDGFLKEIKLIKKYLDIDVLGEELIQAFASMAFDSLDELSLKIRGLEISSRPPEFMKKSSVTC